MICLDFQDTGEGRIHELSGGERQRVALARAVAPEPGLLLFDEPLSALDVKLRKQLRREIKRIQKEAGFTAIYVTHDQEEAMAISDRIAIMNNGKILQCGSPEEIYNSPADIFTADFIGTMNIVGTGTERIMFRPESCRISDPGKEKLPADALLMKVNVLDSDYLGAFYSCTGLTEKGDRIVFNSGSRKEPGTQLNILVENEKTVRQIDT